MPRRYVKRIRYNRDKYSIEQTNIQTPQATEWTDVPAPSDFTVPSYQWTIPIVEPTTVQGMRKVKHLTVSLANIAGTESNSVLWYSIVYVPEGYTPQNLLIPGPSNAVPNYSANQFVMSSGVIDFSAGPTRIRSRLSRNLNAGDSIYIILATTQDVAAAMKIIGQVTYAMTLQ